MRMKRIRVKLELSKFGGCFHTVTTDSQRTLNSTDAGWRLQGQASPFQQKGTDRINKRQNRRIFTGVLAGIPSALVLEL